MPHHHKKKTSTSNFRVRTESERKEFRQQKFNFFPSHIRRRYFSSLCLRGEVEKKFLCPIEKVFFLALSFHARQTNISLK